MSIKYVHYSLVLLLCLMTITLNNLYALDLSNIQDHPRIFLTSERLATLRANAVASDPYWIALKKQCNSLLSISPSDTGTVYYAESLALCYQITNDPKYAAKALDLMKNFTQWLDDNFDFTVDYYHFPKTPDKVFDETDYGNMHMTSIAIAFDWIYNQVAQADREYFANFFNKCVDSAMVRRGYGYGQLINNHFHTKNRTELYLGLASYGDNPRAEELIDTAYSYFVDGFMPIYNKYNVGGQIYMGTQYGYRRTLPYTLFCVEALKTALSIDLYSQNPWLEDVIDYIIYAQAPQGGTTYTFGQAGVGTQMDFSDIRNRQFMSFLRSHYGEAISGEYLETFLNETGKNKIDSRISSTMITEYQFLFRDKVIVPKDYRLDLPPAYLSAGLGLFLARSDWGTNALWFSLQGGDYVGDHQYFDMGHFTLFRGSRLVSNASKNRVLIGQYGVRQDLTYLDPAGYSKTGSTVEAFENTSDYAYTKLDLTRTYYGPEFHGQILRTKVLNQEVSKTTREAILLRPDYVVLYDRTGTINSGVPTTWVVHLDSPVVNIANDTYSCSVNGNNLYIRTLFPRSINVNSQIVSSNFSKIEITPKTPIENELYLHILFAPGDNRIMPSVEVIDTLNMVGLQTLDSVILFSKSEVPETSVGYTFTGNDLTKHILTNMQKAMNYKVLIDGSTLQDIQPTDRGVLAFETRLKGLHTVRIVQDTGQPIDPIGQPGKPIHIDN